MVDPLAPAPRPRRRASTGSAEAIVEAILDAAGEVLARDGYDAMTTRAVAERAGVSVGSLYQYFGDKHAIVAELARREDRAALDMIGVPRPREPARAVERWIRVLTAPELGPPALRRALRLEVPPVWVLDAGAALDTALLGELELTPRPPRDPEVMGFAALHAVQGVIRALYCERADRLADQELPRELFRLGNRHLSVSDRDPPPASPPIHSGPVPARVVRAPAHRPSPGNRRGRATLERILQAAVTVLVEDGLSGLTARRIGQAAGASPGALYRYFDRVPDVLTELARRREERAVALVGEAIELTREGTLRDAVAAVVGVMCGPPHGPPQMRHAMVAHVPRSWFLDATHVMEETLHARALEAFAAHGREVREGPREWMAFFVVHAIQRTIEAATLQRPELLPEPLTFELTELVWRYLRAG